MDDLTNEVRARLDLERRLEATAAELERSRQEAEDEIRRHVARRDQLLSANRDLTEANRVLTDLNGELQAMNEHLQISAEEAQAAHEEAETLNEELQATAEELETLNEELQATVEELGATNEELEARGRELEEMAGALESQYRQSESSRRLLEAVLSSMGDAVLVVGGEANSILTNAAYERMFHSVGAGGETRGAGFVTQDGNGRPIALEETPQWRAARGEMFRIDFTLVGDGQSRRYYEATGSPLEGQGGVVVIRDITDRSLRRLQEEFVALASHELRTPLVPLRSYLQLVLRSIRRQSEDSPQRRHVDAALSQVDRIARLVDDLVDVARLQTGKFSLERGPVYLDELLARSAEAAQTLAQGQTIRLEVGAEPVTVQGDAGRLEQALLNLLTNAITYAPGTEYIDVRLDRTPDGAEILVRDYGSGIPGDVLPNLFSRFYQAERGDAPSRRGLGLGLYITRQIAEAHGGSVDVETAEGEGTTFVLRLPSVGDDTSGGGDHE